MVACLCGPASAFQQQPDTYQPSPSLPAPRAPYTAPADEYYKSSDGSLVHRPAEGGGDFGRVTAICADGSASEFFPQLQEHLLRAASLQRVIGRVKSGLSDDGLGACTGTASFPAFGAKA